MKIEAMQLTKSQEELVLKIKEFLAGPDRVFLLTGKPGVGKTTIIRIALKEYIEADLKAEVSGGKINVAGIALAHEAKKKLGESVPNVYTFAKAYGMKPVEDEITGEQTYEYDDYNQDKNIGDSEVPVFVHDEVSQYTANMLSIVYERTSIFSKIIFVGDRAQLPPITKKRVDLDSPIFSYNIPDRCKHELLERVRQARGNPILSLSDIVRSEIFGGHNIKRILDIIPYFNMNNGQGYDSLPYLDLLPHIKKGVSEGYNFAVISSMNKTVNQYNPLIRNYLKKNLENDVAEGDLIRMTDNYYKRNGEGHYEYALYNSEVLEIGKVDTVYIRYIIKDFDFRIQCYVASIVGRREQFTTPTEEGRFVFNQALQQVHNTCKKRLLNWKAFWDFEKFFCKWTYAYSLTAYKVQGSTYDRIYLDVDDILASNHLTPRKKLQTIYTGMTRASKDVYFLKS